MLVSVNWLKDYVDIDVPVREFADRMILSGSNIETVEEIGNKFSKIQVARIEKITPHPNADKLVICQLDVGEDELLQVVTGAKNVFEGALVPVIRHGGRLPDGTVIKKGKLRGEVSNGMLCSAEELGYEDKVIAKELKDGIWILDGDFKPGTDIKDALEIEDSVIDFEITPNRPDCLSMLGMAREAAAVFGKKKKEPAISAENEEGDVNEYISVEDKKPDLCPRYTARVIKDVKIGPSPWWMQKRLMHGGMRPVNNIVDITNFVMMEYGQPLHAFDINHLKGGKIVIDTAEDGTKFTTLDGVERELDSSMLMINDADGPVAVAGVMGGLNSEITENTDTVVLESANFNGDSVRLTAKKLGLRTEASGKFEKGIDANLCARAADRFCRLVEELGCGTVVGGSVDVYPEVQAPRPLDVRVSRINKVLGTDIPGQDMADIFRSLEMEAELNGDIIHVVPPTVRQDLNIEEDYVEEVARMYGYDRLPVTLPAGGSAASMTKNETIRGKAREILTAYGLDEILTYSFVSPESVDKVNVSETDLMHRNFVKIINPLGEDTSVMRTMLIPSMMSTLERNNARGNKAVRLFEIGKIFNDSKINCDGMPAEADGLCIGIYGGGADFFVLKGYIEGLLDHLGIRDAEFSAESGLATYHPGRCANIISNGEMIGTMGQIRPDVAERYGISEEVYCCELLFSVIIGQTNTEIIYKALPKYPAVTRDIAMTVDEKITVRELEDEIRAEGGNILESIELFDVYRGIQIAPGKKSVAFALTYRVPDRTLTDDEVSSRQHKIVESLETKFGAELRKM
ncbi:MAG: phenylalanine--tRNA ligase subunit beta [Eubacteriales bacterium]|nr:phenylalanine--tRNA ligase subunit beta [Eubacteriales bacterium]